MGFMLAACGKQASFKHGLQSESNQSTDILPPPDDNSGTDAPAQSFKPSICSDLSLKGVAWPRSLTEFQVNVYALAMNISGSFEGHTGWTNISNNFDGQGISLGLFNQNLGQGSLQPMMNRMRTDYLAKMKTQFTTAQLNSVTAMLNTWGGSATNMLAKASRFDTYESDYSDLDDPTYIEENDSVLFEKASNAKNQDSVDWSVKTIYNGSSFKSEWKTAFQKMAGSPEYVTIQVTAATAIHKKAMGYMKKLGFKEMRAYLFFFDIVVQNGGVTTAVENKYLTWVKQNSKATETTKLKKILELRLPIVRKEFVNDVRARKTAVIDGVGTVHSTKRDFKKEYCTPAWTTTFPSSSLL